MLYICASVCACVSMEYVCACLGRIKRTGAHARRLRWGFERERTMYSLYVRMFMYYMYKHLYSVHIGKQVWLLTCAYVRRRHRLRGGKKKLVQYTINHRRWVTYTNMHAHIHTEMRERTTPASQLVNQPASRATSQSARSARLRCDV